MERDDEVTPHEKDKIDLRKHQSYVVQQLLIMTGGKSGKGDGQSSSKFTMASDVGICLIKGISSLVYVFN